ncbi:MAG: tetratricopeptide repeat protein [Rubrivivax sp.]
MRFIEITATVCLALLPSWALAAGGDDTPSWNAASQDPAVKAANASLAAGDYTAAQASLKIALAANPGNADLNNLYAYALRKGSNPDMAAVFKHYNEALRIDPKHLNANEYIGEAYLMSGNLAKAKEHLAVLDKLCLFGCEQYSMLKKSIATYETKTPK